MTPRLREVYELIVGFIKTHGYSPTLREICDLIGVKSVSTAKRFVDRLVEYSLLSRIPRQARSLRMIRDKPDISLVIFPKRDSTLLIFQNGGTTFVRHMTDTILNKSLPEILEEIHRRILGEDETI